MAFASRTSAEVKLCICLASVTSVEEDGKGIFRVCYAPQLGKAACDKAQHLVLKAAEEEDMRRWIAAIHEGQERRRRDRHFVPLSVASERLVEQRRRVQEAEAEAARHRAAAAEAGRGVACQRLAAAAEAPLLAGLRRWALGARALAQAEAVQEAEARAEAAGAQAKAAEVRENSVRLGVTLVGVVLRGATQRCLGHVLRCLEPVPEPSEPLEPTPSTPSMPSALSRALAAGRVAREAVRWQSLGSAMAVLRALLKTREQRETKMQAVQASITTETGDAAVQAEDVVDLVKVVEVVKDTEVTSESTPESTPHASSPRYAASKVLEACQASPESILQELGLPSDTESESEELLPCQPKSPKCSEPVSEPVHLPANFNGDDRCTHAGASGLPIPAPRALESLQEQGDPHERQEGCISGRLTEAASSVQEVQSGLLKLQDHLEQAQVAEAERQEDSQYAQRWMLEVAACDTDALLRPSACCTGSSYDPWERESSSDVGFASASDSDLSPHREATISSRLQGGTGGDVKLQLPLRRDPWKRPPPPRCLPVGTPSQRARSSSASDTEASVTRGKSSQSPLAPLPSCDFLPQEVLRAWRSGSFEVSPTMPTTPNTSFAKRACHGPGV